jgi:hypothetical protein
MKSKIIRILMGLVAAFIALTATGGGISMLTDVDKFPIEWLAGTPFTNYTIPALMLAIVVGGSSLWSAITLFTDRKSGAIASMAAGLIMMGYIVVEVLILKQDPPGPTLIEVLYFGLGITLFGLA